VSLIGPSWTNSSLGANDLIFISFCSTLPSPLSSLPKAIDEGAGALPTFFISTLSHTSLGLGALESSKNAILLTTRSGSF